MLLGHFLQTQNFKSGITVISTKKKKKNLCSKHRDFSPECPLYSLQVFLEYQLVPEAAVLMASYCM